MRVAPIPRAGALMVVALFGGCVDGVYRCDSDPQCVNGEGAEGACVSGYCAYADQSCPSGRRWGAYAGDLAGECTPGPDAAPVADGASVDGAGDAGDGPSLDGANCVPELCNGLDDDCDGDTDEDFVLGIDCDGLDGDDCLEGVVVCDSSGTGTTCDDATGTIVETCNGVDDDCDGQMDEGFGLGDACDGPDGDFCNEGIMVCNGSGGAVCNDATGTNTETCNGSDDDCDGDTDEGFAIGVACDGLDADLCNEGMTVCNGAGNGVVCNDATGDNVEVCNSIDDNCNALTDEGFNVGASCDGGDTDACLEGMFMCDGAGGVVCSDLTGSTTETCNGLDDDCRNGADDPWPLEGTSCTVGIGACQRTGTYVCNGGGTDVQCSVTEGSPSRELCGDGVDSDCSGGADPSCPSNDLRSGAVLIAASGTFSADLTYAHDDVSPTCAGAGGRDVFYQFAVPAGGSVIYAETFGSNFDTVLRLETGACTAAGAQTQCVNDSCTRTQSHLGVSLAAGTYCLVVDQQSSTVTNGSVALSFAFGGRTGTALATGTNLTLSGNTCSATDVSDPAGCAFIPDTSPDVAYFYAACPGTRTLTATTCNASTAWDTVLYVRQTNAITGPGLACNDDDLSAAGCPGNVLASRVENISVTGPGLFWMTIDGYLDASSCGSYQIVYTL